MADTEATVEYLLTTVDNPFNPFTMYDQWLAWDIMMGYNTTAFLDRIARVSSDLSEPDQALAIDRAMDEIVEENVSGMWKKVSRSTIHEVVAE
jgi:hypothetical protein